QLVLPHLEVAQVQPLHPALEQRIALARGIEIVDYFLLVDLQLYRVDREEITDVHRQEHRHLGVGGEQQLLLQDEQILVEIDHVLLQSLDVLIEPTGIAAPLRSRRRRFRGCQRILRRTGEELLADIARALLDTRYLGGRQRRRDLWGRNCVWSARRRCLRREQARTEREECGHARRGTQPGDGAGAPGAPRRWRCG